MNIDYFALVLLPARLFIMNCIDNITQLSPDHSPQETLTRVTFDVAEALKFCMEFTM